jgi:hypothetical protein
MVRIPVRCPRGHTDHGIKGGKTKAGHHRYKCHNVGSRPWCLRVRFRALSRSVCIGSISRLSAHQTRFSYPAQPFWPVFEHTSAAQRHDHPSTSFLRLSVAGATAARGISALGYFCPTPANVKAAAHGVVHHRDAVYA